MQQRTMQIQLTDYGVSVLQTSRVPPTLELYKLGSAYGYVADSDQTALHGNFVSSGVPDEAQVDDPNNLKYRIAIADDAALTFGEIGLFYEGKLLAIAVSEDPISKPADTSMVLDLYLPMVGTNFPMWYDYVQESDLRLVVLSSIEQLPQAKGSGTNAYIVQGASSTQSPFIAITDRMSKWVFDAYQFASRQTATLVAVSERADETIVLHINKSEWLDELAPTYLGKIILQFTSGAIEGVCRYLTSISVSADETRLALTINAPLSSYPAAGDTIEFVARDWTSTTNGAEDYSYASTIRAGIVVVGDTLTIDNGVLNIKSEIAGVKSVAGRSGNVLLTANDITGLSTVAKTGSYNDLLNLPAAYTLPKATRGSLGGVIIGSSGLLTINNGVLDFNGVPVKMVNNVVPAADGNVTLVGLLNPTESAADMNTLVATGLYYAASSAPNSPSGASDGTVTVTPSKNGIIQTWNDGAALYQRAYRSSVWGAWTKGSGSSSSSTSAVTSVFGRIGDVLLTGTDIRTALGFTPYSAANPQGYVTASEVSAQFEALVGSTTESLAALQELANQLTNDSSAVSSIVNSLANKSDIGHTHTIANVTGLQSALDAKAAASSLATVATTGSYNDLLNKPTAYSLPAATASTIGGVKPGTNLSVALDGTLSVSGLATVATSGSYADLTNKPTAYSLPIASATVLGGIKIGSGLSIAGDGTVTATASGGVTSFNARTGAVTLSSSDISSALGFTPYSAANPAGYITSAGAPVQSVAGLSGTVSAASLASALSGQTMNITGTASVASSATTATRLATARAINLTGDITGSGSFDGSGDIGIGMTLASSGVAAGTYRSVTVDVKGRVTGGTNPTTLAGYGITDAYSTTTVPTFAAGATGFAGGSIKLAKAPSSTKVTTDLVMDVYDGLVRIYESGGTGRGVYFDLTTCAASAGTSLLASATAAKATNVAGGSAMAIHYQSAADTTSFLAAGTAGYLLQTNGTGTAPTWVAPYSLPTASTTVLGGVKVDGTTVTISGGVISSAQYSLPTASASVLGGVKVDGTTITITNGVISAVLNNGILNAAGTPLSVNSTDSTGAKIALKDAGTVRGYYGSDASYVGRIYNASGASVFAVDSSGNVTAAANISAYSDATLKTNVKTIQQAMTKVRALRGVTWDWRRDGSHGIGVIAQEVATIVPEVVQAGPDHLLSVAYGNLVGVLVEAIKELDLEVQQLKAQRA